MRTLSIVRCLVIAALTASAAHAQKLDAARLSGEIAPLVDGQTLMIAHVDLNAVATADLAKLADLFQLSKNMLGRFAPDVGAIHRQAELLKQQGVHEVFMLVNAADAPSIPVMFVVPLARDADIAKITGVFNSQEFLGGKLESVRFGNQLVIASSVAIERVRAHDKKQALNNTFQAPRPEVAQAFDAVNESAMQLLFVPSAETRRVVEEMTPMLPQIAGGGPIKPFTSGLRWMAVGVTMPPKQVSLKVVVQAADAQAATTLAHALANVIAALGKQEFVQSLIPKFDELTRLLVPTVDGERLSLEWTESNGGLRAIVSLLGPPVQQLRDATDGAQTFHNLKQFGLAMHNYLSVNHTFPPRAILSKDGKPLLSWRVAILPYLEGNDGNRLYKEFHLDEPWDSEHNRQLIDRMPAILRSPHSSAAAGRTTYLAPIFPGGIFGGAEGLSAKQVPDGLSNTILVVEGDEDHAVVWTKPEDIEIDVENPGKGLVVGLQRSLFALLADGSAKRIPDPTAFGAKKKQFGAMFTADGADLFRLLDD